MIGLYLYATGAQRQAITVLSTLGLSESYSNLITRNVCRVRKSKKTQNVSINSGDQDDPDPKDSSIGRTGTLRQLSDAMREQTRTIAADGLFGTVYDNINMQSHNAEQIVGRHGATYLIFTQARIC